MSRPMPRAPPAPQRAPARPASSSSRAASPPPARQQAPPKQQQQQQQRAAAPPPQQAQAQSHGANAPQQVQPGGRGMMGDIMTTAAGVAAGHVAGRAVDRMIWGGESAAAPVEEQGASVDQAGQYMQAPSNPAAPTGETSACGFELLDFRKCLEQNNNNLGACQWNYDVLLQCQGQLEGREPEQMSQNY
eukprot:CAMPEP_0198729430 /NCGR_PEP_ID=MMETSP1475-20131203/18140_1 /TAXON_ID= ORGANISM="Unidentified sp., Strain CCMP1999" /NCGR_SAMPLE_ID=MMETSP1475 /ASSEMBLY_ACC=CAM_ASM_001111 /LENGTH=188 /DNA_ID=CAMNT_0044492073 /DNA_START=119 /DNA_END=685 /DNA_ORIENTATION=-